MKPVSLLDGLPRFTFYKVPMALSEVLTYEAIVPPGVENERRLGGFRLPAFQRPSVWSAEQKVALIESIWLGFDFGSYALTEAQASSDAPVLLDGFLLDGQQRIGAILEYCDNQFPVFGRTWESLSPQDKRVFKMTTFPRVFVRDPTEDLMRDYYNRLNFSGVRHTEDQRA